MSGTKESALLVFSLDYSPVWISASRQSSSSLVDIESWLANL